MRKNDLTMLLLSFLLVVVVACTFRTAKNDADTVTADDDTPHMEGDTLTGDDAVVSNDETIDEVLSDNDAVVCPDLKVYENVKTAGFPLKDTNGKITFCRPGCDAPTENDPQCARNIWDWLNWGRHLKYKDGSVTFKECYPWPCEMPDMSAMKIDYSECDKDIDVGGYHVDMSVLYDLRIQNGMLDALMMGASIEGYPSHRMISYDIAKDIFTTVAYGFEGTNGYGRFLFSTTTDDITLPDLGYTYIVSAKRISSGYKYEVIYDDEQHMAWFSRPPLIGEKWVVLNIEHRTTKKQEVLYSKVDEWNWHPLKYGKVYEGNVVDNRLTFINDNLEVYVCDLDKLPYDPSKECIRIDRTGETPSQPRLNEENKDQLVYISGTGEYGMTLVDISGTTPVYSLLSVTPSDPQVTGIGSEQFKGNFVLYTEAFMPVNSSRQDYKTCFYRIDTKKQYCPTKPSFKDGRYDMGFNSFDGNYQLWKAPASINARFRDISCYCEKEGVCPFEGLKK